MSGAEGFTGALDQAVAEAAPLVADTKADQMALFDDDLALPGPLAGAEGQAGQPRKGKIGRPKGARNRSNEQMVKHLLANYRHPLYGLFDVASTSIADLARALVPKGKAVTREDLRYAAEFWRKCNFEAASYVQGKAPVAVVLEAKDWPQMSINLGVFAQANGDQGPQMGMDAGDLEKLGITKACEDKVEEVS